MDSQCARKTHVDSSFQPWNYSQDQTREFVFANARSKVLDPQSQSHSELANWPSRSKANRSQKPRW